jgi:hypothetical protein
MEKELLKKRLAYFIPIAIWFILIAVIGITKISRDILLWMIALTPMIFSIFNFMVTLQDIKRGKVVVKVSEYIRDKNPKMFKFIIIFKFIISVVFAIFTIVLILKVTA